MYYETRPEFEIDEPITIDREHLKELVKLSKELRQEFRRLEPKEIEDKVGYILSLNDSILNKLSYYINPRKV